MTLETNYDTVEWINCYFYFVPQMVKWLYSMHILCREKGLFGVIILVIHFLILLFCIKLRICFKHIFCEH